LRKCSVCGAPVKLGRDLEWLDYGVIRQRKYTEHHMVFYESDNIDGLFFEIERLIGLPLEHIVIESKRKDTREYVEKMFPAWIRRRLRRSGMNLMVNQMRRVGSIFGYGKSSLQDKRIKGDPEDYITIRIENPHSVLLFAGECLGAWEALQERDSKVEYRKVAENTYDFTCRIGEHPLELKERLLHKEYRHRPVDFSWERCPKCDIPMEVSRYEWDLENGIITSMETGRRMSVMRPDGIDSILDDLESELGEDVPRLVIDAQRIYTRKELGASEFRKNVDSFRWMLAFRGLGYLSEMDVSEAGLHIEIKNFCMPLMMVGIIQAFYELNMDIEETSYSWKVSDDALSIDITG